METQITEVAGEKVVKPVLPSEELEQEIQYVHDEGIGFFSTFLGFIVFIGIGMFIFMSGTWYEKSQPKNVPIISPVACDTTQSIIK